MSGWVGEWGDHLIDVCLGNVCVMGGDGCVVVWDCVGADVGVCARAVVGVRSGAGTVAGANPDVCVATGVGTVVSVLGLVRVLAPRLVRGRALIMQ